jgi:hypothetical protein
MADHPKKLVVVLTTLMEEAEQVAGSTGADKRLYVVEAMRRLAASTLSLDEAILVGGLTPALVDLIVAASKGLIDVNIIDEKGGEPSLRCCALM